MQKALEGGLEAAILDSPVYRPLCRATQRADGLNPAEPYQHRGTRADAAHGGVRAGHRRAGAVGASPRRASRSGRHRYARRSSRPTATRCSTAQPSRRCRCAEQAGWMAHEVLHIALRHPQRFLDLQQLVGDVDLAAVQSLRRRHRQQHARPPELAAVAVYGAVHAGVACSRAALGIKQVAEAALLEWDVERLYRAIDDRRSARAGTRRARPAPRRGRTHAGARAMAAQPGRPAARALRRRRRRKHEAETGARMERAHRARPRRRRRVLDAGAR
ncbi:MAG: hypothetical protein V9G29_01435 [Burkholderiaceae bacterium]